ncbi:MAG: transposase [bacterium]
MNYIQPADRYQYKLMSSLDDIVESDHPVRILDKIVGSIVLSNKERFESEAETGRPAYHPATHVKLYLYGYFNGISSSRKLEAETRRNKEVIWLLGGLSPDHWTISNYRKEKSDDIKFVTKKFREFLKAKGYIKLKTVAIDGSKVKAYTDREMLTKEKIEIKLEKIDKKIEEYLSKIAENDERDEIIDEIGYEGIDDVNMIYISEIAKLKNQMAQLEKAERDIGARGAQIHKLCRHRSKTDEKQRWKDTGL